MTLSRRARWTTRFVPLVVLFVIAAMFFTTALSSAQTTADDTTTATVADDVAADEVAAEDGTAADDGTDTSTEVDDAGTVEEVDDSGTADESTETTEDESTDEVVDETSGETTEEDAIEDGGEAEQTDTDSGVTEANAPPSDPPGNNGTVKIDGVEFDSHPNNQPHVGCTFQVDFYGFDEGDLDAVVTFALQSPTKAGRTLTVTSGQGNPSTVDIGEDPAGGGTDVDAQETYTLAFTGAPHPIQGYHVKLTVNAEGSIGADTKHKVFWVEGCVTESQPPSSQPPSSQPPSSAPPSVGPSVIPSSEAPSSAPPSQVLPSQIESEGPSAPPSQVLPSQQVASPSSDVLARRTTTAPSQLPFTGGSIVQLLAGSGLLLLTGGGLLLGSRRSRKDP